MLHGHGPDHAGRAGPECRRHGLVQTLPHVLRGRLYTRIPHQAPVPVLPGECHQPLVLLRTSGRGRDAVWEGVSAVPPPSPVYSLVFLAPSPCCMPVGHGLIPAGSGDGSMCAVCLCVSVCDYVISVHLSGYSQSW